MSENKQTKVKEEIPPFFNSWQQIYISILIIHALIILMLYLFTFAYK